MNEEINIAPSGVTENDLRLLAKKSSELAEARICELWELADSVSAYTSELMNEGLGICEILSLVSEGMTVSYAPRHDGALPRNIPRLSVLLSALTESDRALFADLLVERLREIGIGISEESFIPKDEPTELFTYVKNVYSDEAYDVFSEAFDDPRLRYSPSFKDAVRSLTDGEVGYALLPLEERGVRLPTVEELIYRNDLKLVSVTPVFGQDTSADLKYALVARNLVVSRSEENDDRYLEVRVSKTSGSALIGLMLASELYGLEIYRLGTVSFGKEEGREDFYSAIFRGEGCDFTRILTYLTLFSADFVPVGMYKNLE